MKFSKRAEYGIRASIRLARSYGKGYVQSREIASSEHLPAKFLESILLALRSGGILESKVGAGGGYRLTRPPTDIHVTDLLKALLGENKDAPPAENDHETGVGQYGLDIIVERMNEAIEKHVGEMTLAELLEAAEHRATDEGRTMYYI